MKRLPPPDASTTTAPTVSPSGGRALERRSGGRATPGKPFGRRQADEAILQHTYPAPFVVQAAAASQPPPGQDAPKPSNPYGRTAPTGLVFKTHA